VRALEKVSLLTKPTNRIALVGPGSYQTFPMPTVAARAMISIAERICASFVSGLTVPRA